MLILYSTAVDYLCALSMERRAAHKKLFLAVSLTMNLGLLFFFKYFNFFGETLTALCRAVSIPFSAPVLNIILPVGISFYTFQTLSYTIDVYRERMKAERDFVLFALFVSYFPQLVAGPIERAADLLPQLREAHTFRYEQGAHGARLMAWGFFKKCVCAVYRQTTAYRNLERTEETEKYRDMPKEITFAVFGASHGRDAFQKEDYVEGFFNFSMSSQTSQYDLMQLREFSKRIASGATVVLTVSYLSPFWTDTEESFAAKQERYYRILSPRNIVDCDVGHWVLQRWSPLLTMECGSVISAFLHPEELRKDTNSLYGRQELTQEVLTDEQERVRKNHLSAIEPAMPNGNPVMLDAYREIFSLCKENGWNAVLVTPPYPAVYTECFPSEVMDRFCAIMEVLSEENGVPWLNYAQDCEFTEKFAYFKNIDHLNLAGAYAFAAKLKPRLTELGLWQ